MMTKQPRIIKKREHNKGLSRTPKRYMSEVCFAVGGALQRGALCGGGRFAVGGALGRGALYKIFF